MAWTRELADALRATAAVVMTPEYDWGDAQRCNCGLLARELTGMTGQQLREFRRKHDWTGCWGDRVRSGTCPQTGEPLNAVMAKLFQAGLTSDDIINLEVLADRRILDRAGPCIFCRGHGVSKYMLAWADMIDEQLGPREAVPIEVVPEQEPAFI